VRLVQHLHGVERPIVPHQQHLQGRVEGTFMA
jgi:hypothetical protein